MNIFQILLIQPLTNGLVLFYKILGENMGLSIVFFSIFLRIITNPLTKPYMESMKKLKDFEPQLNKLKEKYKNDKKKLVEAQTEFYKQNGINPGGGCLPYLLQIVILIALFNVFNKVFGGGDIASKLNELLYQSLKLKEGHIVATNFLYLDITKPDIFRIPGIPVSLPGPMLILAAIFQFISAKITQTHIEKKKIEKKQEEDMQATMQQSMIYTFPLFTILFGMKFPSGLAIYWLLFSVLQTIQQYKTSGWGGLTPFISKLGLLKSASSKDKKQ
jgi:YidC/Oxa1 family membrane protein insertase